MAETRIAIPIKPIKTRPSTMPEIVSTILRVVDIAMVIIPAVSSDFHKRQYERGTEKVYKMQKAAGRRHKQNSTHFPAYRRLPTGYCFLTIQPPPTTSSPR